MYSVKADLWVKIAPLSKPKTNISACNIDNKFISAIAGCDNTQKYFNDIDKYIIETDQWENVDVLGHSDFIPRIDTMSQQINYNTILIAGGHNAKDGYLQETCILSIKENQIQIEKTFPNGLAFINPSAVVFSEELYAIGSARNKYKIMKYSMN